MSLKKTCLTKSTFKEIGFRILLKNIQIRRCFNSVRQHVPKSGSTDWEGSVSIILQFWSLFLQVDAIRWSLIRWFHSVDANSTYIHCKLWRRKKWTLICCQCSFSGEKMSASVCSLVDEASELNAIQVANLSSSLSSLLAFSSVSAERFVSKIHWDFCMECM